MPEVLFKVSHYYLTENIKALQVTAGILLLEMQTGYIGSPSQQIIQLNTPMYMNLGEMSKEPFNQHTQ